MEEENNSASIFSYCLVNNIPLNFHASDLRNYFSSLIEDGKFDCFHFRHRPQICNTASGSKAEDDDSSTKKTLCSLVRFSSQENATLFIKRYDKKFWMDKQGNDLNSRCLITLVKVDESDEVKFAKELRPPRFMPQGNVGTRNSHFLTLIRNCRLPPSLIQKLGLEFPTARRYKKFSKVPFDYQTEVVHLEEEEEPELLTGKGHAISDVFVGRKEPKESEDLEKSDHLGGSDNESGPDDDDDRCEDWERHIATVDDHTSQDRIKERLYEEPAELVWEKGGPGIVWYTDAAFWDEQKGGFDERTADNLDIDMDIYYEHGAGDKDARDMMEMRQSTRFRTGLESVSVFKRPDALSRKRPLASSPPPSSSSKTDLKWSLSSGEPHFEKYSKGVARKIMEKCGWKDGNGLGKSTIGITEALSSDGQNPRDKRGIGFYGEKLEFSTSSKDTGKNFRHNPDRDYDDEHRVSIGTVYDNPQSLDTEEPLLRSNSISYIKRYSTGNSKNTVH